MWHSAAAHRSSRRPNELPSNGITTKTWASESQRAPAPARVPAALHGRIRALPGSPGIRGRSTRPTPPGGCAARRAGGWDPRRWPPERGIRAAAPGGRPRSWKHALGDGVAQALVGWGGARFGFWAARQVSAPAGTPAGVGAWWLQLTRLRVWLSRPSPFAQTGAASMPPSTVRPGPLESAMQDILAVVCHFDPGQAPPLIRLHHVRQEPLAL